MPRSDHFNDNSLIFLDFLVIFLIRMIIIQYIPHCLVTIVRQNLNRLKLIWMDIKPENLAKWKGIEGWSWDVHQMESVMKSNDFLRKNYFYDRKQIYGKASNTQIPQSCYQIGVSDDWANVIGILNGVIMRGSCSHVQFSPLKF